MLSIPPYFIGLFMRHEIILKTHIDRDVEIDLWLAYPIEKLLPYICVKWKVLELRCLGRYSYLAIL